MFFQILLLLIPLTQAAQLIGQIVANTTNCSPAIYVSARVANSSDPSWSCPPKVHSTCQTFSGFSAILKCGTDGQSVDQIVGIKSGFMVATRFSDASCSTTSLKGEVYGYANGACIPQNISTTNNDTEYALGNPTVYYKIVCGTGGTAVETFYSDPACTILEPTRQNITFGPNVCTSIPVPTINGTLYLKGACLTPSSLATLVKPILLILLLSIL